MTRPLNNREKLLLLALFVLMNVIWIGILLSFKPF